MIEGRLEEKNRLRHSKQALELEHGENSILQIRKLPLQIFPKEKLKI